MIRLALMKDLDQLLEIYAYAREFMKSQGNPHQWKNHLPTKETLIKDIENKQLYVIEDKQIEGCFVLIIGEDPTYQHIEGKWLDDSLYGTIHRIASSQKRKGIFDECIVYAKETISHLRIDTHKDNQIMQHLITKHGFIYTGIIYVDDGSARLAYEWSENHGN